MSLTCKREALRKLVHLSSFWMVAVIYFVPHLWCVLIFSILTAFVLMSEYEVYRQRHSFVSKLYRWLFMGILRQKEKGVGFHLSGASYVLMAALFLVIICSKELAMFGLSVLIVCDTMAALVGKTMGRFHLVECKTLEGTLSFIFSGFLIALLFNNLFGFNLIKMFVGVILASILELYNEKIHVDDNLSIPLAAVMPFLL